MDQSDVSSCQATYRRTSVEGQGPQSLANQREMGAAWLESMGFSRKPAPGCNDDPPTGARAGLEQVLRDIASWDVGVVVVASLDRLGDKQTGTDLLKRLTDQGTILLVAAWPNSPS